MSEETTDLRERAIEALVTLLFQRHRAWPAPRVTRELRERIEEGVQGVIDGTDQWYQAAIGQVPQLIPDEQGTPVILKLLACDECGSVELVDGLGRCGDHPEAGSSFVDYPVRKIPEGFKHLGVGRKQLQQLVRDVRDQRQAALLISEVGQHRHNARIVLRYAAEKAGYAPDHCRVDDAEELVRLFAEPDAGVPVL